MSEDDMKAELERLRRENATLKKGASDGTRMKVSEEGAVSVYGMGRFPVTLYKEQWLKLLNMSEEIRAFIAENESRLKAKESQPTPLRTWRSIVGDCPPLGQVWTSGVGCLRSVFDRVGEPLIGSSPGQIDFLRMRVPVVAHFAAIPSYLHNNVDDSAHSLFLLPEHTLSDFE
jgi:hypothetical protein